MRCDALRQYGATIGMVHYCGKMKSHSGRHYCYYHKREFSRKREVR